MSEDTKPVQRGSWVAPKSLTEMPVPFIKKRPLLIARESLWQWKPDQEAILRVIGASDDGRELHR